MFAFGIEIAATLPLGLLTSNKDENCKVISPNTFDKASLAEPSSVTVSLVTVSSAEGIYTSFV